MQARDIPVESLQCCQSEPPLLSCTAYRVWSSAPDRAANRSKHLQCNGTRIYSRPIALETGVRVGARRHEHDQERAGGAQEVTDCGRGGGRDGKKVVCVVKGPVAIEGHK